MLEFGDFVDADILELKPIIVPDFNDSCASSCSTSFRRVVPRPPLAHGRTHIDSRPNVNKEVLRHGVALAPSPVQSTSLACLTSLTGVALPARKRRAPHGPRGT